MYIMNEYMLVIKKHEIEWLVNRQCLTFKDTMITPLSGIHEQQYQVGWEDDAKLVMGQNNALYLLDKKKLNDNFSEWTVDII